MRIALKVYYKKDSSAFLQVVPRCLYKLQRTRCYKLKQVLFSIATDVTDCNNTTKLRQCTVLCVNKSWFQQLKLYLQSGQ